jgi:hypothetical protein
MFFVSDALMQHEISKHAVAHFGSLNWPPTANPSSPRRSSDHVGGEFGPSFIRHSRHVTRFVVSDDPQPSRVLFSGEADLKQKSNNPPSIISQWVDQDIVASVRTINTLSHLIYRSAPLSLLTPQAIIGGDCEYLITESLDANHQFFRSPVSPESLRC